MKIGFCTQYDERRMRFAREAGFDAVEISVGSSGALSPATVTGDELKRARAVLDENGIFATVFHGENFADAAIGEQAYAGWSVSASRMTTIGCSERWWTAGAEASSTTYTTTTAHPCDFSRS